jgi:hypothetical protein
MIVNEKVNSHIYDPVMLFFLLDGKTMQRQVLTSARTPVGSQTTSPDPCSWRLLVQIQLKRHRARRALQGSKGSPFTASK